jgi:hypothetical protein
MAAFLGLALLVGLLLVAIPALFIEIRREVTLRGQSRQLRFKGSR